tara:strand:- start:58 stop:246 length:189 start_codon:yes stop_codon:yes gene_type:complete
MKMLMENWNQFVNEEMSDDEKQILGLLEDVSAPDVVVALENWIRGGKHTMDDLQMHLGKMMS